MNQSVAFETSHVASQVSSTAFSPLGSTICTNGHSQNYGGSPPALSHLMESGKRIWLPPDSSPHMEIGKEIPRGHFLLVFVSPEGGSSINAAGIAGSMAANTLMLPIIQCLREIRRSSQAEVILLSEQAREMETLVQEIRLHSPYPDLLDHLSFFVVSVKKQPFTFLFFSTQGPSNHANPLPRTLSLRVPLAIPNISTCVE